VDVSAPAITRAREPARAEGVRNATFEHADAQTHRFPPERFDLAMSRFGTMFFADPVAGFADLGRALRPAGRLVMTVWQAHERNAWDVAIRRSLQAAEGPAAGAPDRPARGPPSVREILRAAEFADVAFTDARDVASASTGSTASCAPARP
jgi:SAM-dependent methyltransferase